MDFIDYINAIKLWDKKRVEEHKFPVVLTLKYLYLAGMGFFVLWAAYRAGYSSGHLDAHIGK